MVIIYKMYIFAAQKTKNTMNNNRAYFFSYYYFYFSK